MPKKADLNKKQGNQYKSKLLADAKYTGEGLDKYVADGTITQEECDQAKAKARKSIRLRASGELKEAIEKYVADHSDQYKSINDFICQTLTEKTNLTQESTKGENKNMTTNKPTTLIIKDRGTGKTTQLLYTSATTQYPIIVRNHSQVKLLLDKANDLDLIIPVPMTVEEFKNKHGMNYDRVLVDEGYNLIGEALDHYLGAHVAAVTLTDRVKEFTDK